MKKFYYIVEKAGKEEVARIYKNTREGLKKVATTEWRTSAYKGEKAEVLGDLIEAKQIPAKYWRSSANEWRGEGYFAGPVTEKYEIIRL